MKTTAIFAELLVGGLLATTWLLLLVMAVAGPDETITALRQLGVGVGMLGLAYAYTSGVVLDRLWKRLTAGKSKTIKARVFGEEDPQAVRRLVTQAWVEVGRDETHTNWVNYMQSRMRVARAGFFNMILITAAALLLILWQYEGIGSGIFWLVAVVGSWLSRVCWQAFEGLREDYYQTLKLADEELKRNPIRR